MTDQEAKKILALYRPGTADRHDPAFAEALRLANPPERTGDGIPRPDSELKRWFETHCAAYQTMRGKFTAIEPPAGLKEQIVSEVEAALRPSRRALLLCACAVVLLMALVAGVLFKPRADNFLAYRTRMAETASRLYAMQVESHDLRTVNTYLASKGAPSDYHLPEGLKKAQLVGCAAVSWQGQPVSMVCFRSGKPLQAWEKADLWLFVIKKNWGARGSSSPEFSEVKRLATSAWSDGETTYILAAAGDRTFLQQFLSLYQVEPDAAMPATVMWRITHSKSAS